MVAKCFFDLLVSTKSCQAVMEVIFFEWFSTDFQYHDGTFVVVCRSVPGATFSSSSLHLTKCTCTSPQ